MIQFLADPSSLPTQFTSLLNNLDQQFTEILLAGEPQSMKKRKIRQAWSPTSQAIARTFSFWKQKLIMVNKRLIHREHLNQLRKGTNISQIDHDTLDLSTIKTRLRSSRNKWKSQKKKNGTIHKQFLVERTELLASKRRTTEEKALRAIFHAEDSRHSYRTIKAFIGKQQTPLTVIEVTVKSQATTMTTKQDIESQLLQRNQRHSKQSLTTPLFQSAQVSSAINPHSTIIQSILDGTFQPNSMSNYQFNQVEKDWFSSLKSIFTTPISLALSIDDFQSYFKHKQEHTSSSPSGCHMGHYKTMIECIRNQKHTSIPEIVLLIAHMSLVTSTPLHRWEGALQIMLEKGKGRNIGNLRIIQLVEANLNFTLHIIWGKRLMCHALCYLDKAQFAIPGQTWHNAILNRILYLDLLRQTLMPGLMLDYDARAAFDRVINGIANLACQRLSLPNIAGNFMRKLLQDMTFHVVTAFGRSAKTFSNSDDPSSIGQGGLQGSSSACPIYIFNSDVSLSTYKKYATDAKFIHPITSDTISDSAMQFVDDTTQCTNVNRCQGNEASPTQVDTDTLFINAQRNITTWSDLMYPMGNFTLKNVTCTPFYHPMIIRNISCLINS